MLRTLALVFCVGLFSCEAVAASLKPTADTFFIEQGIFGNAMVEMHFRSLRKWHVQNDGHAGASRPNFILEKWVDGKWITAYTYMPGFVLDLAVQFPVRETPMRFEIPSSDKENQLVISHGKFGEVPITDGRYRIKIQLDHGRKRVKTVASRSFVLVAEA